MTNSELLKEKIKISGYKIGYLADELGLSRQAFSNKINNNTDFTVKEMQMLSKLLNLSDSDMKDIFLSVL